MRMPEINGLLRISRLFFCSGEFFLEYLDKILEIRLTKQKKKTKGSYDITEADFVCHGRRFHLVSTLIA
jgi:hypothetical protein